MKNTPWSDQEQRIARRVRLGFVLREWTFWGPASLLCWGLCVFLARFLSVGSGAVLWSGAVLVISGGALSVYRGYQQASEVNYTALLDQLSKADNLLVSLDETDCDSSAWQEAVDEKLNDGVSMPGMHWGSLCTSVLPALAFLLLVWMVPLSGFSNRKASASSSYLQERVEQLREKLEQAEREDLMTDEKAERMTKKLDRLKEDLRRETPAGDNPWSVMDGVKRELEAAMTEGSETLSRAQQLSESLSEELNRRGSGEATGDGRSGSSDSGSRSGTGSQRQGNPASDEQVERRTEALSRALARLSRRGMAPDPSSLSSGSDDSSPYQNTQNPTQSTQQEAKKQKDLQRNWRKLVSRRKTLKKIRRKLRKKHRRLHRKGMCKSGRCRLGGRKAGGRSRKSTLAGRSSRNPGASSGTSSTSDAGTRSSGRPTGSPGNGGTAPMTNGDTSGRESSRFATKTVDAPIVDPEGMIKQGEQLQPGVNLKPGEASDSSGAGATVEHPVEARRSQVPPAYRDSVKSYFSPDED